MCDESAADHIFSRGDFDDFYTIVDVYNPRAAELPAPAWTGDSLCVPKALNRGVKSRSDAILLGPALLLATVSDRSASCKPHYKKCATHPHRSGLLKLPKIIHQDVQRLVAVVVAPSPTAPGPYIIVTLPQSSFERARPADGRLTNPMKLRMQEAVIDMCLSGTAPCPSEMAEVRLAMRAYCNVSWIYALDELASQPDRVYTGIHITCIDFEAVAKSGKREL